MRAPTIRTGGRDPASDGDINLYISPEGSGENWFDQGRRVIFVNGMANTAQDHASSARALSLLQACPVIGVYNRTDGFWGDLGQCITDKLNLVPVQAGGADNFQSWKLMVDGAYEVARRAVPMLSRVAFVSSLIESNGATLALYALLAGAGGLGKTVPIYCHSQGNLITSNALTAVALANGLDAIRGIQVNSFGSPCRYWPPGILRINNAFTFDPVSWLDLRTDLTSSKVGFVAAHGFSTYMENDGEFVVNRFRWGSFGLTASMDEAGLAEFCVSLGNNPRRLRGIFNRLEDAHWSDSDDVAYEYCVRASDSLLRTLKTVDRGFIDQLIRLLGSGFCSPGESAQIRRLRAL